MSDGTQSKGKGCVFYGCITVLVLMAVGAISIYVGVRHFTRNLVAKYTDDVPLQLPRVALPETEMRNLRKRLNDFQDAVDQGKPAELLVLTSTELNALLQTSTNMAKLGNAVFVTFTNDQMTGKISVPLDRLNLPLIRGRYLNGEATFTPTFTNGQLIVSLQSLQAKGVNMSPAALARFSNINFAQGSITNAEGKDLLLNIQTIEIKDSKVVIRARVPAAKSEPEPAIK